MKLDFNTAFYAQLVIASVLVLGAYACGIVGKKAMKVRWWISFIASGFAAMAMIDAGMKFDIGGPSGPTPFWMCLFFGLVAIMMAGFVVGAVTWVFGRPTYYVARTLVGLVVVAYQLAKGADYASLERAASAKMSETQ